jgi:hypothetical protein
VPTRRISNNKMFAILVGTEGFLHVTGTTGPYYFVLATDLATECEEQKDVTESPLERRNLFQATSENITLELSREDLLGAIPYTSLGNNTKQILLRIPSSSSAGSFARNMRRENFLDTLLENLSRDKDGGTEQATKWLMTTLAKKNERLFTEVARERGFISSLSKKMDAHSAAAMWESANVSTTQQRTILRHLNCFFGARFTVPESKVREIGKGFLEPINSSYEGPGKEKITFWYKPVDAVLQHEISNLLDEDSFKLLKHADIVVGGDHGKGKFRMVLMLLLRFTDPAKNKRHRFVVGEIDCKKDTSEVLKQTFMREQNAALKRITQFKRFVGTRKDDGSLGLSFGDPGPTESLVAEKISRVFACGDLAFYALVLGRSHMSSQWCQWCQLNKAAWTVGKPTPAQMWINDPKVQATRAAVIARTTRKRKETGPTKAQGNTATKKAAREDGRDEYLSTEQSKPAGPVIQPHEISKKEYKNNNT